MFQFTDIATYHDALRSGTVTCEDAVKHYLQKIDANSNLNAYTCIFGDEALARARELDSKKRSGASLGKLFGVVVSLKDVISYAGHPLTAASKMLSDFKAVYSATAVQKLLDEGAIIIGMSNCDEFAMGSTSERSVYGSVRNPVDQAKVAGGSSGGSAAAVRAGLCMVSLGSDTGGSVRQPADFCGVVGFKPSYGSVSRYGLLAYASSFDQIGIIANNVDDVKKVLEVISQPDEMDSTMDRATVRSQKEIKKLKDIGIAVFRPALEHSSLDNEIREGVKRLIAHLKEGGAAIGDTASSLLDYIVPAYYVLTTAEASSNLNRFDGIRYGHRSNGAIENLEEFYKRNRSEGFGKEVKKRIMLGTYVLSEGYYDAYFTQAQKVRQMVIDEAHEVFEHYDFLLLPTTPSTAYDLNSAVKDDVSLYLADIFTVYANLTGLPAITIPLFRHSNGMPFGVQLISSKINEINLLEMAGLLLKNYREL